MPFLVPAVTRAVTSVAGRLREDAALSARLTGTVITLREIEKALRTPELIEYMTLRVFRSVKRHAPRGRTGKFRASIVLKEVQGVTRLIIERTSDGGRRIASSVHLAGDPKTYYARRVYPASARAKKQAVTRAAKWYASDRRTQRQIKRLLIPRKRRRS